LKVLFVIHRYGRDVAGGAEQACRQLSIRLAGRGHHVEVLTSAAASYVDWADACELGDADDAGVLVHRLGVRSRRDAGRFASLSSRVLTGQYPPPWSLQRAWFDAQGPDIDVTSWLLEHRCEFDVVVALSYLYRPTHDAVAAAAGVCPVVVLPLAHDEPPLRLAASRPALQAADRLVFLTEQEEALVRRRVPSAAPGVVIGLGVDDVTRPGDRAISEVARRLGIGQPGWLLCLGRLDPSKGTMELVEWYREARRRGRDLPTLVMAGEPANPIVATDGIVPVGVVDEADKAALLAGASVLVQPSPFESFSLVLAEAWSMGTPVLAQGRNEVLAAHVARSGGGVSYRGFAEFDTALQLLLADDDCLRRLGAAGRRYVDDGGRWPTVIDRYEALLADVA
jgi:glycosyltransferase involved in cell wall biosynthesis